MPDSASSTTWAQHASALTSSCADLVGQPLAIPSIGSLIFSDGFEIGSADAWNPDITAVNCDELAKAILAVELEGPDPCS